MNRFQTLSPFLVFIEGTWTEGSDFDAISKANEEFFGQIATIVMKKSAQSDFAILNQVTNNLQTKGLAFYTYRVPIFNLAQLRP